MQGWIQHRKMEFKLLGILFGNSKTYASLTIMKNFQVLDFHLNESITRE